MDARSQLQTSNKFNSIQIQKEFGKLPLSFEANQGQLHSNVKYISRGIGYSLFVEPSVVKLVLNRREKEAGKVFDVSIIRMELVGASDNALGEGRLQLPGKSNYFIGNDPANWVSGIVQFQEILLREVYAGIDLKFYGNQEHLEYDFVVKPGGDFQKIEWNIQGVDSVWVDDNEDLILKTGKGIINFKKPLCYVMEKKRKEVRGRYVLRGRNKVGFEIEGVDRLETLVIDPVLSYSTYLGGSGNDKGIPIAVDSNGNVFVSGWTTGSFPVSAGTFQTSSSNPTDVFVTKLNSAGNAILYSTYIGGTGSDVGTGIAVDVSGNAYVTGSTYGPFPTTPGAYQTTFGGSSDAFVTKLSPNGNSLIYSTLLSASVDDNFGTHIAVDASGNAFICGGATAGFPTTAGAYQIIHGGGFDDAFVFKLNPAGTTAIYSTYVGGSGMDVGYNIAVNSSGNAYLVGKTEGNFPTTPGSFQTTYGGGAQDAFIVKLDTGGNSIVYSTYLGGNGQDYGASIALDAVGNAYITGGTDSVTFPTTIGAIQSSLGGFLDAFLTKISPSGNAILYSTYLGGSGTDQGFSCAVNGSGDIFVAGTSNGGFPTTTGAFQETYGGGANDPFFSEISSDGITLKYSTYFGGAGNDISGGMVLDNSGNIFLTGITSGGYPTTAGAYQELFGGGATDAFVAKFCMSCPNPSPTSTRTPTVTQTPSVTPVIIGTATVTATHTASPTVSFTCTISPSHSASLTTTQTGTWTPTLTVSPTATTSPTFSVSPTRSLTFTISPTPTPLAAKDGAIFSYPNPAAPGQAVHFVFSPSTRASLKIYDWSGRKIFDLPEARVNAGLGTAVWDGRDESGRDLASGAYFVVLKSDTGSIVGKLTVLRP